MNERLELFEKMLKDIKTQFLSTKSKMEALKAEGKVKSATYGQLMANKMTLQKMLSMYEAYGLL